MLGYIIKSVVYYIKEDKKVENIKFLMGNEAIALGALHAGVKLVSGYPGTPSTEILETVAKLKDESVYVEWSVNEKAALEVATGASYAGARTLVTMKQVGLNVASDPLMSLSYVGVKGGMVIVSADDPGPISSQTEQDTRHFAQFAKLICFDPSSPEEAYNMVIAAFEISEKYASPVLLRPTTRVCHGCASVNVRNEKIKLTPEGFIKDTKRWVIFPKSSYLNHIKLEKRYYELSKEFSKSEFNTISGNGKLGIACGGVSYTYVMEAIDALNVNDKVKVLKIGTPYPFPEELMLDFIKSCDKILVSEELDPVIEKELIFISGKNNINSQIFGKYTDNSPIAGENSVEDIKKNIAALLGLEYKEELYSPDVSLPVRPPVLCAGCPHRASFYAVKKAMKNKKAVFSGDIGCYTLGNAMPLDMVDTCLCMGADVTIAQGLHRVEEDAYNFSFIGDSTFFASGITGVINAVYNKTDIILIVLDNSTTAMTGQQPHPGTGITMMGTPGVKISIENVLKGIGVSYIKTVNPFNHKEAVDTVLEASEKDGVRAIIFKAPCIAVSKPEKYLTVNDKCVGCKKCINEIGCPALVYENKKVVIEKSLCTGCGLCVVICPFGAIEEK